MFNERARRDLIYIGEYVRSISTLLRSIAGWIIYFPGYFILPLVVAVWLGERVGASRNKVHAALTVGLINAVYTVLIYVIAMVIIYLLVSAVKPDFFTTSSISLVSFTENTIGIPVAIVLILVPFIASLSAARHSSV